MARNDSFMSNLKVTLRGFLSVWRFILFLVTLGIILPLSLTNIETRGFYYTIFGICVGIMLLSFLLRTFVTKTKKMKVKFLDDYVGIMFHYAFIALACYVVTFLLMLGPYDTFTYIAMVGSAIAFSIMVSRARLLLVFI